MLAIPFELDECIEFSDQLEHSLGLCNYLYHSRNSRRAFREIPVCGAGNGFEIHFLATCGTDPRYFMRNSSTRFFNLWPHSLACMASINFLM